MENDSGLPQDISINTFSWLWDDTEVGYTTVALMAAVMSSRLATLYGVLDQYLSTNLTGVTELRVYDRGDAPPRVPIYTGVGPVLVSANTAQYPNEVAIVLSFAGSQLSGVNQARRRGRIYLGPLGQVGTDDVGDVMPTQSLVDTVNGAMEALCDSSDAGLKWRVWSEADQNSVVITRGWTDRAFDTQRRRGRRAVSRSTWTCLPV